MKSSIKACAIAVLALGSMSVFAQGSGAEGDRNGGSAMVTRDANGVFSINDPNNNRGNDRGYNRGNDRRDYNRDNDRRDYNRGYDRGYNQNRYYYGARGPEWRRGGHIPREYYNRQYYVNDWRGHRLYAPPRGHQWVQVGSDYVLIALATGLIANLVLNQ